MFRLFLIFILSFTLNLQANDKKMFSDNVNVSMLEIKDKKNTPQGKFKTKKEFIEYTSLLDSEIKKMPDIGMFWAIRGLTYLFDYKFTDGYVKADLKKAEYYFAKAIEKNYFNALYPYVITLHRENNDAKALNAMEVSLKPMSADIDNLNDNMKKLYIQIVNLYGGILLDRKYETKQYQNAITYLFPAAYRFKNKLSQLEIGLLYKIIGLKKQSNYFVSEACKNPIKGTFVYNFCKENVTIEKKNCKECKIKKEFNLI